MRLLLNVLWFILGGWLSGVLWLLVAVVLAVSIIGLPWAPGVMRISCFSFAPFGKAVLEPLARPASLILNIVWIVLFGWWLALHHLVLAAALAVTIIGIPFAWQHLKLAVLSLAPVGARLAEA
jgi:uncharacterized membrane protein YccF (DUF307 family)